MYIITLEERDAQTQKWSKTYRSFSTKENALDFLECMYESYDTTRNIQFWEAELIPHAVRIAADVKLLEE